MTPAPAAQEKNTKNATANPRNYFTVEIFLLKFPLCFLCLSVFVVIKKENIE